MKRRELLRHLHQSGCLLFREGRRHTVYFNPERKHNRLRGGRACHPKSLTRGQPGERAHGSMVP